MTVFAIWSEWNCWAQTLSFDSIIFSITAIPTTADVAKWTRRTIMIERNTRQAMKGVTRKKLLAEHKYSDLHELL